MLHILLNLLAPLTFVVVRYLAKSQYRNLEEERDKSAEEGMLLMYMNLDTLAFGLIQRHVYGW
jgi:hypothetical protein